MMDTVSEQVPHVTSKNELLDHQSLTGNSMNNEGTTSESRLPVKDQTGIEAMGPSTNPRACPLSGSLHSFQTQSVNASKRSRKNMANSVHKHERESLAADHELIIKLEPHSDSEENSHASLCKPNQKNSHNQNASDRKRYNIIKLDPAIQVKQEPVSDDEQPQVVPVGMYENTNRCLEGELCNMYNNKERQVQKWTPQANSVGRAAAEGLASNRSSSSADDATKPGSHGQQVHSVSQREEVTAPEAKIIKVEDANSSVPASLTQGISNQFLPAIRNHNGKSQRSAKTAIAATKLDSSAVKPTAPRRKRNNRHERFTCEECGMSFRWPSRYNEHLRKHSGERPFICRECGDAFTSSSYLRVHERKHSGLKPYPCTICGKAFMHGRLLTEHRKSHAEEGAFSCVDCGLKCGSPNELSRHRQAVHPDDPSNKPYSCQLCPAAFQRSYHLETHMRSHTGEKPFPCDICGQSYSTQGSLKVHIRSHTGERPFKCGECDRAFITSGQLKKHSRTHNKPIVTVSEDNKTVYVQTLKPVPPGSCEVGGDGEGRMEEGTSTLKLEIQSYPKDSTYTCDICSVVFVRSIDLASHIRHDHPQPGKKENICRECGVVFSRAHSLKVHSRTHSGVKPFKCDVCGKEFAQRSNLTAHQRTHTRHKPYKCKVCGVSYSSAKYRDIHMLTHDEVRPCECIVCGSTFSSNALLSTHVRSHDHAEIAAAFSVSASLSGTCGKNSLGFGLAVNGLMLNHILLKQEAAALEDSVDGDEHGKANSKGHEDNERVQNLTLKSLKSATKDLTEIQTHNELCKMKTEPDDISNHMKTEQSRESNSMEVEQDDDPISESRRQHHSEKLPKVETKSYEPDSETNLLYANTCSENLMREKHSSAEEGLHQLGSIKTENSDRE